jgi:hypothetical protein
VSAGVPVAVPSGGDRKALTIAVLAALRWLFVTDGRPDPLVIAAVLALAFAVLATWMGW